MRKRGLYCRSVSVRLSVRPSITFVYCIQMAEDIVTLLSWPGSSIILVFWPGASVYSRRLWGKFPPKFQKSPQKFQNELCQNWIPKNFRRDFLFSFWGLRPQTPTRALPLVLICLYCLNCTTFGQLILRKIIKIIATRCQILRLKYTKFDFGWGAYSAPQSP